MLMPNCLRFDWHFARRACSLDFARLGSSIAARIAIIAIVTSNSISVKAFTFKFLAEEAVAITASLEGQQYFVDLFLRKWAATTYAALVNSATRIAFA